MTNEEFCALKEKKDQEMARWDREIAAINTNAPENAQEIIGKINSKWEEVKACVEQYWQMYRSIQNGHE